MTVRMRALAGLLMAATLVIGVAAPQAGAVTRTVAPLTVTTTYLPSGTVGVAYKAVLTATGGTAPYTWTALKPLPAGIVLGSSGVLDGVPRDASTFTLLFSVSDAAKKAAQSPALSFTVYKIKYASGQLFSWGYNAFGQVGDGTTVDKTSPRFVAGMAGVIQTADGYNDSYALKGDGTVWAWGYNGEGQLGLNTTPPNSTPRPVVGLSAVVAIAASSAAAYALRADGTVSAWGSNLVGQLGNNSLANSAAPVPVLGLTSVVAIAAGYFSAMAVRSDGTVWTWGSDHNFDTVNPAPTVPVQVPGISGAIAVAKGGNTFYALRSDGTVWAWGQNDWDQLGDGTGVYRAAPAPVAGLTAVRSLAAGARNGYALRTNGEVWAWGQNSEGELGTGSPAQKSAGVQKIGSLSGITSIAAGGVNGYARRNDGTLWSWGSNSHGQLGIGSPSDSNVPTQVHGLTSVTGVGSGSDAITASAFVG